MALMEQKNMNYLLLLLVPLKESLAVSELLNENTEWWFCLLKI